MPSYSGVWNLVSQMQAVAAGNWSGLPFLSAWGSNSNGQLGLGNTTNYSSPKQVSAATTWQQVSGGEAFVIAIRANGTLWSWGNGGSGQLGLGSASSYSSPQQVGALTTWIQTACGQSHVIAVRADGTLWSWGRNLEGQLGLGNTTQYNSPKQIGALTNWAKVGCGDFSSFSIKKDGTLWAWGSNYLGQLGVGSAYNYYSSPKQVGALTNWAQVTGGDRFTIAVKTDGTLWAWGHQGDGRLGNGLVGGNKSSPVQIGALTNWLQVACGYASTVAVKTDKTLWSWGLNNHGQLGLGNSGAGTNRSSPVQVGALTTWASVASGRFYSAAINSSKALWAWGRNNSGQLGQGNTTSYSSPKQVGALTNWNQVAATYESTIALNTL